jgi:hypothetical protein
LSDIFDDIIVGAGSAGCSVRNLRPSSRGSVHVADAAELRKVELRPSYLSTQEDREVAVDALKLVRRSDPEFPDRDLRGSSPVPVDAGRGRADPSPLGSMGSGLAS